MPGYRQPKEAVAVFGFLLAQRGRELFKIVPAFVRDFLSDAPHFFKEFVSHDVIIAKVRGAATGIPVAAIKMWSIIFNVNPE